MIEAIQCCWYNFSVFRRFMYFIAVRFYKLICHTIIFQFGRISSSKRQKPSTLFYMKEFRAVKEDINFCKLVSDGHCFRRIFPQAHFQVYTVNTLKSIVNWKNRITVLIILKGLLELNLIFEKVNSSFISFWIFSIYSWYEF